MPRPILASIEVAALRQNMSRLRSASPTSRMWVVMKANAYGHGLLRVFHALKDADGFAVLDIAEAELLRNHGWNGPLLLIEGCFDPSDLDVCSRLGLWHTVHCAEQISMLEMHRGPERHRIFLKMNSGMNRLGFRPDEFKKAWERLKGMQHVGEVSLITHFSDADASKGIALQMAVFDQVARSIPGERSVNNSAATLRHANATAPHSDWIRSGIAVYGCSPDSPSHDARHWGLEPAMTLSSKLIGVQSLTAGETVGYGSSFVAERDGSIGIVACGYADGYPRHCPTGTPILVAGQRTRVVGRVSMDMLAVDLGPVTNAAFGSEVVLWGRARNGTVLSADEVAAAAGTIAYELLCGVAPRVPTVRV